MVRLMLLFFVVSFNAYSAYITPDSISNNLLLVSARAQYTMTAGTSSYTTSCTFPEVLTGCYAIGGVGSEDTNAIADSETACRCIYKTPSTASAVCIKICTKIVGSH